MGKHYMIRQGIKVEEFCLDCGKKLDPNRFKTRKYKHYYSFCDGICYQRYHRREDTNKDYPRTKPCLVCGRIMHMPKYNYGRWRDQLYCSQKCQNKSRATLRHTVPLKQASYERHMARKRLPENLKKRREHRSIKEASGTPYREYVNAYMRMRSRRIKLQKSNKLKTLEKLNKEWAKTKEEYIKRGIVQRGK